MLLVARGKGLKKGHSGSVFWARKPMVNDVKAKPVRPMRR
jgi:hypothetical protein